MDLSYETPKEVQDKEQDEEIHNNPTFKLVNSLISDLIEFILKFTVLDIIMTYIVKFNGFDFIMFDHLAPYMNVSYPYRPLYAVPFLLSGLLIVAIIYVPFKSISNLTNPFNIFRDTFRNYYANAQLRNFNRKNK